MTFFNKDARSPQGDNTTEIVTILSQSLEKVTTSYIEQLSLMEQKHWEQLEKQSTKQLQILEKQTKDFISVMKDFIEASKPVQANPHVTELIRDLPQRENAIAKEEVEEQHLEDIERIPMTNGINVQFEGSEEILPISIS